jgi:arylformamidase
MSTPAPLVHGPYDQTALDREYNNREKVADAAEIGARWMRTGAEVRRLMSCEIDVDYGPHPRQCYDVFPAEGRDRPILAFIHGGYWHSREKDLVHFLAPPYVASDVTFISIDYRLCPEVGVGDVVADVAEALRHIHANARTYNGDPRRIHVAGHSAGGHLTAMMCGPRGVPELLKGGCSISGLHDLEPIRLSYLNEHLNLAAEDVPGLSPITLTEEIAATAKLPPLIATVGGDEGPEYLRQRDQLVKALHAKKQPALAVEVPGGNHFTALEAFGDPHHELCLAMLRQIHVPSL